MKKKLEKGTKNTKLAIFCIDQLSVFFLYANTKINFLKTWNEYLQNLSTKTTLC